MKEFVISEAQVETAILVGLITQTQDERKTKEYLDELEFLAETAGATVVKRFTQKLPAANSVTYVGKGKLEEIKEYIHQEEENEREVGMVIFDDELSAKQIRNIEAELKVKILDRTSLILDIFAMRAQTANAKTQVELAQYKYMLPRLQRLWTHLERQGGGSGAGGGKGSVGLRGPGETQLEMDRRIILNRMSLLKERLAEIDKQKSTQRKNRGRMIRVALVGYTNVGKSTLMNLLSKSEVFAENKLFATLDTTVRKVIIENLPFLLTDTVGFIRKLPTDLVDSFKSTLDEVREADLLIHVVDISHPDFEEQISVVDKTITKVEGKLTISKYKDGKKRSSVYGDYQFEKGEKIFPDKLTPLFFVRSSLPHQSTFFKSEVFDIMGLYEEHYKIVADRAFYIKCFLSNQFVFKHISYYLSIYDMSGISNNPEHSEKQASENAIMFQEHYGIFYEDYKKLNLIISQLNQAKRETVAGVLMRIINKIKKVCRIH